MSFFKKSNQKINSSFINGTKSIELNVVESSKSVHGSPWSRDEVLILVIIMSGIISSEITPPGKVMCAK